MGANNITIDGAGFTITVQGNNSAFELYSRSGVTIKNVTVVSSGTNQGRGVSMSNSNNATIQNNTFSGLHNALYVKGTSSNVLVDNNDFSGSSHYGVWSNNSNNINWTVTNNDFTGGVSWGLHYLGLPAEISGNDFTGSTNGIYLRSASNFSIIGNSNTLDLADGGTAIGLDYCNTITVEGLTVIGNGGRAVSATNSQNITIDGLETCGKSDGVYLSNGNGHTVKNSSFSEASTGVLTGNYTTLQVTDNTFHNVATDVSFNPTYSNVTVSGSQTVASADWCPEPPLASVTYLTPADGATGFPLDVLLEWELTDGATGYYFNLGTDNPPTNVSSLDLSAVSNFFQDPSKFDYSTTYYWSVQPYNATGPAAAPQVLSFTTMDAPLPAAITYTTVADASTENPLDVLLQWDLDAEATGYYFNLGTDNPPTNVSSLDLNGVSNFFQDPSKFEYSTTYYWSVQGHNQYGTGPAPQVWSFTTMDQPPYEQTFTILGANGSVGDIDPYSQALPEGATEWQNAYLTGSHPWGYVPGTNSWVNFDPNDEVGLNTTTPYRIRFVVPDDFTDPSLTFQLKADNRAVVWVNNTYIGQFDGQATYNVVDLVAEAALQTGLNEIRISLVDWGGIVGLNYRVDVTMTSAEDITDAVLTIDEAALLNNAPLADAGPDQSSELSAVTLDGSASSDPDGNLLSYSWSIAGSEVATGVNPTITLADGSYTVLLTVTDGELTDTDEMAVTVATNTAPLADAGADQNQMVATGGSATVSLDGSASSDPDGDVLAYIWSGSFGTETGVNPTISLPVGNHVIDLTVDDSNGGTATDQMLVTIIEDYTTSIEECFALDFNNPNQRVAAGDDASVKDFEDFTIEVWVKPGAAPIHSIIRKNGDYNLYLVNNLLYAEVWPDAGSTFWKKATGPTIQYQEWTHVAASWDKSLDQMTFFVNGVESIGNIIQTGNQNYFEGLQIGATSHFGGQAFSGELDEVRIWNTTRTEAQISANYESVLSGNEPGLAAYYPMNEGAGTTLVDHSFNNNDGTFINNVSWTTSPVASTCNTAPLADAGTDQTVTGALLTAPVTLDGSASSDPDGDDITYSWSENGSEIATGANPTVDLTPGTHTITLTVSDGELTASDDIVIEVIAVDPPTFTPVLISGYTDILTDGGLVEANNLGANAQPVTVGCYDFGNDQSGLSGWFNGSSADFCVDCEPGSAFDVLLSSLVYQNGGIPTLTIDGLTPGNPYRVQLLMSNDANSTGNTATISVDGTPYTLAPWQNNTLNMVVDFTALSSSVVIAAEANNGSEPLRAVINAYLLHDLSQPDMVCNVAPVANAGADQSFDCVVGATDVALNGSATTDEDGDALTYSWSLDGSEVSTSVSFNANLGDGTYTYTLTVSDGLESSTDDMIITVVADTEPPTLALLGDASITLPLFQSFTDPGYEVSDVCDTDVTVTVTGSVDVNSSGSYTLTYTATDAAGNSAVAERSIQVFNSAPMADAGADQTIECVVNLSDVVLDGSASSDPDGTSLTYSWTLAGQTTASAQTAESFTASLAPGTHTYTLVVSDGEASSSDEVTITIIADTEPPILSLSGDNPAALNRYETYAEAGYDASDACGGAVTVAVDGSVDINNPGIYTLTYTASDEAGNTTVVERSVEVINAAPVAVAGDDQSIDCVIDEATFALDASASTDADGDALTYSWSLGGTEVSTDASFSSSLPAGVYTYTLSVSDGDDASSDEVMVTLLADTTAPVLALLGDNPTSLFLYSAYAEAGFEATDECASVVDVAITGAIDINMPGSYTLTYTATDEAGNTTVAERVVDVANNDPVVANLVDDVFLSFGDAILTAEIDLSTVFEDVDVDDVLSFAFTSDNDAAATVTLTGAILSMSAVDLGDSYVELTATDPWGGFATTSFSVIVNVSDDLSGALLFAMNEIELKKEVEVFSGSIFVNNGSSMNEENGNDDDDDDDGHGNDDDDDDGHGNDDDDDDGHHHNNHCGHENNGQGNDFQLKMDKDVMIAAGYLVKADRIEMKRDGLIASDVYTNYLDSDGDITGTVYDNVDFPLFENLPPFKSGDAGSQNITVQKNQEVVLEPGDYGRIYVKDRGTLTFTGGVYNIKKLEAKKYSHVRFEERSEVRVEQQIKIDKRVYVGPAGGSYIDASDIIFYVQGQGSYGAKLEERAEFYGTIYVANGKVELKKKVEFTGAILAPEIKVDKESELTLDSYFDNMGGGLAKGRNLAWIEPAMEAELPEFSELKSNYPNPFNPSTTIDFALKDASDMTLKIYDIRGAEVATLVDGYQEAGHYSIHFTPEIMASGTYLYVLDAGDFREVRRMLYLK